jgi:acyl-[acyl-carrier-protein]-phospholipid O-acyltransferase/long-chain-fatty-acid--[acyl-carrier-protein] ligase
MAHSHVITTRRFLPLMLCQFLGSLNDNLFKTAVAIMVTFRTSDEWHMDAFTLLTLSGATFLLPYTFFCATGGKLADKYDKAKIARIIKLTEIGFMLIGALGFYCHLVPLLFVVLFCMGTHSAFFSPVKYALIPEHLRPDELMEGNAFIESVTFISMLLGTIAGGFLILKPHGEAIVSASTLIIALLGVCSSRFIPPATTRDPSAKVRLNFLMETCGVLAYVSRRKNLLRVSLANSWFWFVCIAFVTLFPAFTKEVMGADEHVATLFLTAFSVGIGLGTIVCGATLDGVPSLRSVPLSTLAMSLFAFDLFAASPHRLSFHYGTLLPVAQFFSSAASWRMAFDLFMLAFCGGFYIVPLYAVLQQLSEPRHRAQVMACNNIINAFFMVASSLMALIMSRLHYTVADVFLTVGLLNLAVGLLLFTPQGRLVTTA